MNGTRFGGYIHKPLGVKHQPVCFSTTLNSPFETSPATASTSCSTCSASAWASPCWCGGQTYRYSFSFDDFHADREQVFRAVVSREGSGEWKGICPHPVAQMAQRDFAGITSVCAGTAGAATSRARAATRSRSRCISPTPPFFPCSTSRSWSVATTFSDCGAVLLTEKMALKYFGTADPLGKPLLLYVGRETLAAAHRAGRVERRAGELLFPIPTSSPTWKT